MDYLYVDYDNSLIDRTPEIEAYHFYGAEAALANEKRALRCIRYALEEILQWDADKSIKQFDRYVIKVMRLEKLLSYISFPPEVPFGDPRYILSLLYPDKVRMNQQDLIEEVYERVLKGDGKQFPREYFVGGIGFRRFCFCLKYLIENKKTFTTVEEIYEFFNSAAGKKFLYEYRLKVPADQFAISMMDAIYNITKREPHSTLLYHFYCFQNNLKKLNNLDDEVIEYLKQEYEYEDEDLYDSDDDNNPAAEEEFLDEEEQETLQDLQDMDYDEFSALAEMIDDTEIEDDEFSELTDVINDTDMDTDNPYMEDD